MIFSSDILLIIFDILVVWEIARLRRSRRNSNNLKNYKKRKSWFRLRLSFSVGKIWRRFQILRKRYFWGGKGWPKKWWNKLIVDSTKNKPSKSKLQHQPQPQPQPQILSPTLPLPLLRQINDLHKWHHHKYKTIPINIFPFLCFSFVYFWFCLSIFYFNEQKASKPNNIINVALRPDN